MMPFAAAETGQADRPARQPRTAITALEPAGGPPGTVVSINGGPFGEQGRVTFGTRRAKVISWSDRRLVVAAPRGRRAVKVRVRSRGHGRSNPVVFAYAGSSPAASAVRVLANNDLGMHCVDESFKVMSILPPYNVINAQVIGRDASGQPQILDESRVVLRYSPIADQNGSINSGSVGKTDFWTFATAAYGAALPLGQGLKGLYMPADAPDPSATQFTWNNRLNLFSAEGVPIVPVDDQGRRNRYPLMRIAAFDRTSGRELGSVDTVLPVSEETTCRTCHAAGTAAAVDPAATWVSDPVDPENASRLNILRLHDLRSGTTLEARPPILCASCHYSPALDLAGNGPNAQQSSHATLSAAIHAFHADKMQTALDQPDLPGQAKVDSTRQACYECHPGRSTECLRGAMSTSLTCQNCHGRMDAVGGHHALASGGDAAGRRHPWTDEPRCESCHTGDVVNHLGGTLARDGLRHYLAYDPADPAATPRTATNRRFAENAGVLFRHSKGHGGVSCAGCHGSPHAIWPADDARNPNDNVASKQLQGHAGVLSECATCHADGSLPLTLDGPHGLHPINDPRWVRGHERMAEDGAAACSTCHGTDFRGTPLSVATADRIFAVEHGTRSIRKGEAVGCYTCHDGPGGD